MPDEPNLEELTLQAEQAQAELAEQDEALRRQRQSRSITILLVGAVGTGLVVYALSRRSKATKSRPSAAVEQSWQAAARRRALGET